MNMHKFWFPGWRYGEALVRSRMSDSGKSRQLDASADTRGFIKRLDDLDVNEPFFARRLRLLVFQNTIGEINDLRRELIPTAVLVDLMLFVLHYLDFDRSLIFIGVAQPQGSFRAQHLIFRM